MVESDLLTGIQNDKLMFSLLLEGLPNEKGLNAFARVEAVPAHLLDRCCHDFASVSKLDFRLHYWSKYEQKTNVIAYKSFQG